MFQNTFPPAQMSGPPLDIEGMLYEMSMARGHMGRQISSTSAAHRPGSSRVSKPSSAGNSPQYMQRRRTSASHKIARYRSELYPMPLPNCGGPAPANSLAQHIPPHIRARPVSWHPSTVGAMGTNLPNAFQDVDPPYRHSMADYQTVDVNGMATPVTQPDNNMDVPSDPWFSLENPPSHHHHHSGNQMTDCTDYTSAGLRIESSFQTAYQMDPHAAYTMSALPTSDPYPTYSTQAWTDSLSAFPAYTAPPTPDFLPIQRHADPAMDNCEVLPLTGKEGTELIGMGLYDDSYGSCAGLGSLIGGRPGMLTSDARSESVGKGLKLEETWEPPEEEDESDSEDEAEGEDDDDDDETQGVHEVVRDDAVDLCTQVAEQAKGNLKTEIAESGSTTEAFRELYGDMSNQTFFFDSDSGDNYADMGVEQSMFGLVYAGQNCGVADGGIWR